MHHRSYENDEWVKSDYNGIIKEILISDAEPVEYGEALFVIEE